MTSNTQPQCMDCENEINDLCSAIAYGDIEDVMKYINSADVNTKDCDGMSPLHIAAICGRPIVMNLLLARRADMESTYDGGTILHAVAKRGYFVSMKVLIEAGANPNAKDRNGMTPRQVAEARGHQCAADLLNRAEAWNRNK